MTQPPFQKATCQRERPLYQCFAFPSITITPGSSAWFISSSCRHFLSCDIKGTSSCKSYSHRKVRSRQRLIRTDVNVQHQVLSSQDFNEPAFFNLDSKLGAETVFQLLMPRVQYFWTNAMCQEPHALTPNRWNGDAVLEQRRPPAARRTTDTPLSCPVAPLPIRRGGGAENEEIPSLSNVCIGTIASRLNF